jgi:ABC-type glycerol-3-phosphate transport system permease component
MSSRVKQILPVLPYNFFVWFLLILYLLPVGFMVVTALKPTAQLSDRNAPLYPAQIKSYDYQGDNGRDAVAMDAISVALLAVSISLA